jgi:dipeptidyl aminopeptidase/acylaminoacyl peptidase
VVLYRFSGEFFTDVLGNYPIQAFAGAGMAVALVSIESTPFEPSDSSSAFASWIGGPFAQILTAVDHLVAKRIADPGKVGLMGWSYGSFLTDYAITHSDRFMASSTGDGGLWTLGSQWLVDSNQRATLEAVAGGPPYGRSLENWLALSPTANAHQVRGPVLMEYAGGSFFGAEFFHALRRHGRPAELVVYPGAPHVFHEGKPSHRWASINRNLDWFRFWLLEERDPDPAKDDQYERCLGDRTIPKAARR